MRRRYVYASKGPPPVVTRGSVFSGANFSPCGRYRYSLWRRWGIRSVKNRELVFIGLNPSTADEMISDPTVTRCINLAKREGFPGMMMLNMFAFRSTDPKKLLLVDDPVGPRNLDSLLRMIGAPGRKVIACWGSHKLVLPQAKRLLMMSSNYKSGFITRRVHQLLYCLGTNKDGNPRHPLYLPSDVPIIDFPKPAWLHEP